MNMKKKNSFLSAWVAFKPEIRGALGRDFYSAGHTLRGLSLRCVDGTKQCLGNVGEVVYTSKESAQNFLGNRYLNLPTRQFDSNAPMNFEELKRELV